MSHRLREDWLPLSFYRFLIYEPVTFKVFFLMDRPSFGFLPRFFPPNTLFLGVIVPSSAVSASICIFNDSSMAYSSLGAPPFFFAAILLICLTPRLFNSDPGRRSPLFIRELLPFIIERSRCLMAVYVCLASLSKRSTESVSTWMASRMKSRVLWQA